MKIYSLSGIVIACSLLVGAINTVAQETAPKPQLKIDSLEHNFGVVSEGTKVSHQFQIENVGTADGVIQRIIPTCGCTTSAVSADLIHPGDKATLNVEVDTTGFSGEKLKTVRLYTNDPDNGLITVGLKGTILSDLVISPTNLNFGEVVHDKGTGTPREVTVTVRDGSKISLGTIQTFSKYITVKEVESSANKKRFTVSLKENVPAGEFRDRVIITLASAAKEEIGAARKEMNIPVFAVVKRAVRLDPYALSFGVIEGSEPISRSVKVENLGEENIKVSKVSSNNDAVNAVVKPIKEGKLFLVEVTVNPSKIQNDLRAALIIETTSKEDPSLTLNVYGILPPKA